VADISGVIGKKELRVFHMRMDSHLSGILDGLKMGHFKLPYFIEGPLPYKVEYPYGLPGDGFRSHARQYNATCVAYHRGVDPAALASVCKAGNAYRYIPGDERYEELKQSMIDNGFVGGPGQMLIVHVDENGPRMAEGNHRLRVAVEIGIEKVDVQVRYLMNSDERIMLIPFDPESGGFPVIHE
jgi:hypothetical protein